MKLSKLLKQLGAKSTVIGPFKGTDKPVRSGVYVRVSPETSAGVFAHYDAHSRHWGLYADDVQRALERKHKRSKKVLPWYAAATSATAQPLR